MVAIYHLHCCSRTLPSTLFAANIFLIWCLLLPPMHYSGSSDIRLLFQKGILKMFMLSIVTLHVRLWLWYVDLDWKNTSGTILAKFPMDKWDDSRWLHQGNSHQEKENESFDFSVGGFQVKQVNLRMVSLDKKKKEGDMKSCGNVESGGGAQHPSLCLPAGSTTYRLSKWGKSCLIVLDSWFVILLSLIRCLSLNNFNPIPNGGGADLPPPSCICVYACVYAYTRANFLWLFLILSVEEGTTGLTPKKCTVFSGTKKVGLICPIFVRGDPYDPHKPPEKVTFSDR